MVSMRFSKPFDLSSEARFVISSQDHIVATGVVKPITH
jgi:hypothetical protein